MRRLWRKLVARKTTHQQATPAAAPTYPTTFTPRVESFGRVHCAIDYDMANLAMIEVDGGFVAIDAGSNLDVGRKILAEWQARADGRLKALIFTHSHPDHIGGAAAMLEKCESHCGDVVGVWAQRQFLTEFDETQLLPNAYFRRGAMLFGYGLPAEAVQSNGIGPPLRINGGVRAPVCVPTHTFDERADVVVGGVRIELHAAPGETRDQLFVWLPSDRTLFVGDNLYKAFPNLYTLRGVSPRPIRAWIDSLDAMRRLDPRPELLILGHTAPVAGADRIYELLTAYRDAIAFVHDSVVRRLNEGSSVDEIARTIRLPRHLAEHPYLQEHYGTIAASVRGIADGYMGWFDGDSTRLDPPSDVAIADWLSVELGEELMNEAGLAERIDRAISKSELGKALWLSRLILGRWPDSRRGKRLQAEILRRQAEHAENPLVRNWQLSDAARLTSQFHLPGKPQINGATIEQIPLRTLLRLLPSRLNPRTTANVCDALGFAALDTGEQFTLLVRQGVGELADGLVESPSLVVRAAERDLKRIFLAGDVAPVKSEFWKCLEFDVPGDASKRGALTPFKKLLRLARVSRFFIRP